MSKLKDIFVSLAIVLNREDTDLTGQLEAFQKFLEKTYAHYEIVLIGSQHDCEKFSDEISQILKKVPCIRYIQVFNNVMEKVLYGAGLENAIGDIVLISRLKLYNEQNILKAVDLCCAGNDLVCGISPYKQSFLQKIFSKCWHRFFRSIMYLDLPSNDLPFRGVSRRLINASLTMNHFHEFVFLKLSNSDKNHALLELTDIPRSACKKSIIKAFSDGLAMMIFNSIKPLRIVNLLALTGSFAAVLLVFYTITVNIFKRNIIEGWSTIMLMISFFFFLLCLVLSFIGEYLGRLIMNDGKHQSYNVLFEKHSSVMLDYNKLNIRDDSTSLEINLTQTGRDR